jgi:tight adherence protein B
LLASGEILVALAFTFAFAFGAPRWYLGFAKKRRLNKFLMEFPNAVDVIVRGVKAGLPLGDCMRVCARDSAEPVKSEFRKIIETTQLGLTIADATEKLYERVPIAEANFFGIVISVQQKAGGNLSEVLGNLSKVLRDRKKMKQKIQAMSMEAKSSAAIIGALPGIVMVLVYLSTPDYIALLWTTSTGQFLMMLSGCWMLIGILVMRKMINFDF